MRNKIGLKNTSSNKNKSKQINTFKMMTRMPMIPQSVNSVQDVYHTTLE